MDRCVYRGLIALLLSAPLAPAAIVLEMKSDLWKLEAPRYQPPADCCARPVEEPAAEDTAESFRGQDRLPVLHLYTPKHIAHAALPADGEVPEPASGRVTGVLVLLVIARVARRNPFGYSVSSSVLHYARRRS